LVEVRGDVVEKVGGCKNILLREDDIWMDVSLISTIAEIIGEQDSIFLGPKD
jgi:hypothetical protein